MSVGTSRCVVEDCVDFESFDSMMVVLEGAQDVVSQWDGDWMMDGCWDGSFETGVYMIKYP